MLAIDNLSAGYGPLTALSNVTIDLAPGARVGIFGHNGAGKTTLLKCVVGVHVPSTGTVRFDGRPIDAGNVAATVRSGIAYVPQGHNVFPNLSVEQNLNISGLLFDATFSRQVFELFPILNARRAQTAGSMSGGEQQMLALGMALMTRPKWLLLDEPFTGLAPIIIEAVMKQLREVNARYGTGLLIVEQNVPITLKAVDRAIILKSGKMVFEGAARELETKKDLLAMVLNERAATEQRVLCGEGFLELCTWAATISTVPPNVLRRACLVLADDIAAIVAAATEPEVAAVQTQLVCSGGSSLEATMLGRTPVRTDRHTATAANGMAICWAELDEGYRLVACHAGAYIIPALIAEGEAIGASTHDVIASLAVAYEVTARIAYAFPAQPLRVHPHGAFAPLGAATGIARLRGYSPRDFASATSSAMTMSHAGPYSHAPAGALTRNAWTATGAWAGYRAADWAPLGIGGLAQSIFDVMVTCYGHDCLPDRLTSGLGTVWAISSGYHKTIACCQYAHSAVEAMLRLRSEEPALSDSANIAAITVATHPMGETLAVPEPETVLAGKFSMLHAVATTAVHGSAGAAAFARGSLSDQRVTVLRNRVRLVPHDDIKPWPKDRPARVEVTLNDGRRLSASIDSARGGPDDPFNEGQLHDKIASLTAELYPAMPARLSELATSNRRWADEVAAMVVQPHAAQTGHTASRVGTGDQ